jgi:hypothetical protein
MYIVIETACFPNKWKVIRPKYQIESNRPENFFPTEKEAQTEADRRNER